LPIGRDEIVYTESVKGELLYGSIIGMYSYKTLKEYAKFYLRSIKAKPYFIGISLKFIPISLI